MDSSILADPRLYDFLFLIDRDLAEAIRVEGCRCGGRLHQSNYPRKPRGGPSDAGQAQPRRLSWCCAREGCRKRRMPPSVRFLGRRVYWAAVVVLVSAMACGITATRAGRLRECVGVSVRTLRRWRAWWLGTFVASALWRGAKGRFAPPVAEGALPASLVERFAAGSATARGEPCVARRDPCFSALAARLHSVELVAGARYTPVQKNLEPVEGFVVGGRKLRRVA